MAAAINELMRRRIAGARRELPAGEDPVEEALGEIHADGDRVGLEVLRRVARPVIVAGSAE
jgi:hypothetical protein